MEHGLCVQNIFPGINFYDLYNHTVKLFPVLKSRKLKFVMGLH